MPITLSNAIHWFEIPARNLARAQSFYETVLGVPLRREQMGPDTLVVFASDPSGVGGCLVEGAPATAGTVVYLNANPSLDAALARVERAGGRITTPKTALPDGMGCYAHMADTEGNRVGLHADA